MESREEKEGTWARRASVVVGSALVGVLSNSIQTSFFTLPEQSFGVLPGSYFSIFGTVVTALALLAMALVARRSPKFVRAVPYLGLVLTGLGLAAMALGNGAPGFLIAADLLIGVGVAFGFGFWIVVTAGFGYQVAVLLLVGFRILSALGSWAIRAMGSFELWMILLVVLFAALVPLTLVNARNTSHVWRLAGESAMRKERVTGIASLWPSIAFVCVFGFASGAQRGFCQIEHVTIFSTVILAGTLVGALGAFAIVKLAPRGFEGRTVRIAMLLGLATLYMAFPFAPERYWIVFFGLGDMLYVAATMHMNFVTVATTRERPLDTLVVLGVFRGCVFLSVGLGFAANNVLHAFLGRSTTGLLTLSLAVVYLVMLGALPSLMRKTEKQSTLVSLTEEQIRSNHMLRKMYGLSDREMDVVVLTLGGSSASAVAEKLYVTENTVKTHLKRIYAKLDVHSKEELRALVTDCVRESRGQLARFPR